MKEKYFLIILTAVLFAVIILVPSIGWGLQRFVTIRPSRSEAFTQLSRENELLRTELARLHSGTENTGSSHLEPVSIFSRYPFNFKHELLLNKGGKAAISSGQGMVIRPAIEGSEHKGSEWGILLGIVERVYPDNAVVQTIFDERWRSAVRIGRQGTDALLTGGLSPKLTLVPKTAKIQKGDIIYSADPRFPYGLTIGQVNEVGLPESKAFQEASITFGYDINELLNAHIIKDYASPTHQ